MHVQSRQCVRESCRFRFPWTEHDPPALRCPRCGAPAQIIFDRLLATERTSETKQPSLPPVAGLLDNVRSAFNVGSIFRGADGAGVTQLYLCGITPTPAHPKVAKTALGAEETVRWSYHNNAVDLAHELQAHGSQLWVLEDRPQATSLFAHQLSPTDPPLVLVLGNEVVGVDPDLIGLADRIIALPMQGSKRSLNVAIAFGIAAYTLRFLAAQTRCYNTD